MATTQEIKQIAQWAINRTRKLLLFSSNFPDPKHQLGHRSLYLELARRSASNPQQKQMIRELYDWHLDMTPDIERYPLNDSNLWLDSFNKFMHFKSVLGEVKSLPTLNSKYKDKDELLYLEGIISKALKFGMGNCEEMTALTAMFLFEYPEAGIDGLPKLDKPVSVENVAFNVAFPNDHVFLILNRNPDSKLDDITSWNDDTVICDPWSQEVYTKDKFLKKMEEDGRKVMIEKFKTLSKNVLTKDNYYVGEQYNKRIHTDHWYKKSQSKYWHPEKLIDLQDRPVFPESLPKMQRVNRSIKINGDYSLDLIESATDIPEFFELFGGLKEMYTLSLNEAKLDECITDLQRKLNIKSPPYEFPLFVNMCDGQTEKNLLFYKNQWLCIEGDNRIVEKNGNLIVLVEEFKVFARKQKPKQDEGSEESEKPITLSISRATKDLCRSATLLQPWYEAYTINNLPKIKV